ncbi:MAG TPA: hypothetical protein VGV38_10040 [Pyrinomonadaceae bacterium]|nr:hypothetical protein [Pyrinomonadaceae bacterium]
MADYDLEEDFPGLAASGWRVTSEATSRYNCIAFALRDTGQWWELLNVPVRGYYWPPGVAQGDTVESWIEVYALHGFRPCEDARPEEGFEKVALYEKDGEPTHVARQLEDGTWTSKLGEDEDIEHGTLEALEGDLYGRVTKLLKRPRLPPRRQA